MTTDFEFEDGKIIEKTTTEVEHNPMDLIAVLENQRDELIVQKVDYINSIDGMLDGLNTKIARVRSLSGL